jgi:hypothetical protein
LSAKINKVTIQYFKLWMRLKFRKLYFHLPLGESVKNDKKLHPRKKSQILLSRGIKGAGWIESGTYLGETSYLLSRSYPFVKTIEPDKRLHGFCLKYYSKVPNIEFIEGLSEVHFEKFLRDGASTLNFWLDGHFSEGLTHNSGQSSFFTEMESIKSNVAGAKHWRIFIDDYDEFPYSDRTHSQYPTRASVESWVKDIGGSLSLYGSIAIVDISAATD